MTTAQQATPEITMINRVMALCYAPTSVVNAWTFYLADKALAGEPELRNKLFCLLICGLVDAGKEFQARLRGIEIDAKKIGMKAADYYLPAFSSYVALALDVAGQLTREETIYVTDLRNQWLHGRWDEILKEARSFYFVKNGKVEKEKVPASEVGEIMSAHMDLDAHLAALRNRVESYKTFFWSASHFLADPTHQDAMRSDLALLDKFEHPKVALNFPPPDYKPDAHHPDYLALSEVPTS